MMAIDGDRWLPSCSATGPGSLFVYNCLFSNREGLGMSL